MTGSGDEQGSTGLGLTESLSGTVEPMAKRVSVGRRCGSNTQKKPL